MIKKKDFFYNFNFNSKKFSRNLNKTKTLFTKLKEELKNGEIPLLNSFEKEFELSFSNSTIKKFSKFENIIIIGMGGSILGTKCLYSFLKHKIKKKVFFFDNLDSSLYSQFKKIKNLKKSCFVVISKSGNTLETITNLSVIFSKTLFKNKLIIITEIADSHLMTIGNKYNAEIIEHKEFIGGRYSVLSESGMLPASLMGLNPHKFKNLQSNINNKNFVSSLIQNVASIVTLNDDRVTNSVILSYNSCLNNLGYWYQQLVAESLGKQGKGINPILSFCPKDHHSLLQLYLDGPRDKFFTFLNVLKHQNKNYVKNHFISKEMSFLKNKNSEFIVNAQYNATKNIFKLKKIPFREITFYNRSEEEIGKIFAFFVLETILISRVLNVNPFNQPAVEQVKVLTKKFLV